MPTMIFKQEASERELELRHDLIQAQKEFRAMPDTNSKEGRGKLFRINELTRSLRIERESRQAREKAVRSINGDDRILRQLANLNPAYLILVAVCAFIALAMTIFGYIYTKH